MTSIFDPSLGEQIIDVVLGSGVQVMLGTIVGLVFTALKRAIREMRT